MLGLVAWAWASDDTTYGGHHFLASGLGTTLLLAVVATVISVRLGLAPHRWWRRLDFLASFAAVAVIIAAAITTHHTPYPPDTGLDSPEESGVPVLLIGPNGPIQNLYAYDTGGAPVEVLLYDQDGNPILTLPGSAYDQAEVFAARNEPFIWEGYEIRFAADTYGRPIGNLYPLQRYSWTESGARAAPQPPPVVGIPEIATSTAVSSTTLPTTTTTEPQSATTMAPQEQPTQPSTESHVTGEPVATGGG